MSDLRGFEAAADDVAHEMNTAGVACLRDAVSAEWLDRARHAVASYLPMNGRREIFFERYTDTNGADANGADANGADAEAASFARDLTTDARVTSLLKGVVTTCLPRLDVEDEELECSLRLIAGEEPASGPVDSPPLWLHYDGTVITMVVPIIIPDGVAGCSGELILHPNRRPFRRFSISNVVEKFVAQNNRYRKYFLRKAHGDAALTVVPLEPGNAYLFCGYRSYHATLPCPPGGLRVTLVLHFGALHRSSSLLRTAKSLNHTLSGHRRMAGLQTA